MYALIVTSQRHRLVYNRSWRIQRPKAYRHDAWILNLYNTRHEDRRKPVHARMFIVSLRTCRIIFCYTVNCARWHDATYKTFEPICETNIHAALTIARRTGASVLTAGSTPITVTESYTVLFSQRCVIAKQYKHCRIYSALSIMLSLFLYGRKP